MEQSFEHEREILSKIRNIDNPHLIRPIGSYEYKESGGGGYFLFAWAEGGNLREFWVKEQIRPLASEKMMIWVLRQLHGISQALAALHDQNCRHGDIKPENILLFADDSYIGTLRIADTGLSKIHKVSTEERVVASQRSATNAGTLRYISPEFLSSAVIPRGSDIWQLGCVFLEFLIWALYGRTSLRDFNRSPSTHFWTTHGSGFAVDPSVKVWIDRMNQDLAGPETALQTLLKTIRSHMLVPEISGRLRSQEVCHLLARIYDRAEMDPTYALDTSLISRLEKQASLPKPVVASPRLIDLAPPETRPVINIQDYVINIDGMSELGSQKYVQPALQGKSTSEEMKNTSHEQTASSSVKYPSLSSLRSRFPSESFQKPYHSGPLRFT